MLLILFLITLVLSSCSMHIEPYKSVEVRIDDMHPYEEHGGDSIWYTLRYYDGEKIVEERLKEGTLFFDIKIKSGGLRPISVTPLGTLYPLGGFYEDGDDVVYLDYDYGPLAEVMLSAVDYAPRAVDEFSFKWLRDTGLDIRIIDQSSFLEMLYDGSLKEEDIKYYKRYEYDADNFPSGYWVSDSPYVYSFNVRRAGDKIHMVLFPGVYSFWCKERGVLSVLLLDDDGSLYSTMRYFDPFSV